MAGDDVERLAGERVGLDVVRRPVRLERLEAQVDVVQVLGEVGSVRRLGQAGRSRRGSRPTASATASRSSRLPPVEVDPQQLLGADAATPSRPRVRPRDRARPRRTGGPAARAALALGGVVSGSTRGGPRRRSRRTRARTATRPSSGRCGRARPVRVATCGPWEIGWSSIDIGSCMIPEAVDAEHRRSGIPRGARAEAAGIAVASQRGRPRPDPR